MAGVVVALGAQATLYLTLRRIAVATMPAWAHGHIHHRSAGGSGPAVVGVALVAAATPDASSGTPAPIAAPVLLSIPVLPVPPPVLPGDGSSP